MSVEMTLAVSEFSRAGHGLALPLPKKSRYPSIVNGAVNLGGFAAASDSLWKESQSIQRAGATKKMPRTQAASPTQGALRRRGRAVVLVDVAEDGADAAGAAMVELIVRPP